MARNPFAIPGTILDQYANISQLPTGKNNGQVQEYIEEEEIKPVKIAKGGMPPRNKKNFRSTKAGAGMTQAGVMAYRRKNPGSKLKTAVTEDSPGPKRAARENHFVLEAQDK